MANTVTQRRAEQWVRDQWLPSVFGQPFRKERRKLLSGGKFEFDAVSADGRVVGTISTSRYHTSSGKGGAGKMNKIRSDMLFLTLVRAHRRIVILTETDMFSRCQAQMTAGRLPQSVELLHAKVSLRMAANLRRARRKSAREVSGRRAT